MITIVLLMLRHRWRRAVTICALATFIYGSRSRSRHIWPQRIAR